MIADYIVKNKNNNIEEITVYMSVRIFCMLCHVSFIFLLFCNERNFQDSVKKKQ